MRVLQSRRSRHLPTLVRQRFLKSVIAIYALAWVAAALPSDAHLLAPLRLVFAVAVACLLPGHAVIRALGWFPGAIRSRERVPLAFGIGYGVLTLLYVISAAAHLSIAQAFAALTAFTLLFALSHEPRRHEEHGETSSASSVPPWFVLARRLALPLAIAAVFVSGWIVQPPITGEETAELISIRKILQNPFISFDGIMPEPHAVPTYVIAPYYFYAALAAKASGLSMIAAYVKLRAVHAALALLAFSALTARLLFVEDLLAADAITVAVVVLLIADPDPWSWPASLFPLARRGAFAAGVLAPIFMLASHVFLVRRPPDARPRFSAIAPGLLLLTLLSTHAMEILYAGFFAAGLLVTGRLVPSTGVNWKKAIAFGAALAITAVVFKTAHVQLAGHVYAFDAPARAGIVSQLRAELGGPGWSLWGISKAGNYLIATSGAVIPYAIVGVLLTPVLIRLRPLTGTILWAATIIPLGVYCSSKLFAMLQLATSSEILFAFGYFALLGTLAFLATLFVGVSACTQRLSLIGHVGVRQLAVLAAVLAAGIACVGAPRTLLPALFAHPLAVFWVAAVGGAVALVIPRHRSALSPPLTPLAAAAFLLLVAGTAWALRGTGVIAGSRPSMATAFGQALRTPSALDWPQYYPVLQAEANPPIDLPLPVIADLERVLPPLQTLIADPAHSFSLPVVLNQHIVNPGHRISTSLEYFERYTHEEHGTRVHPIFNQSDTLTAVERQFLHEFQVQYILVDPPYREVVGRKLAADPEAFQRIYERDGFLLFRVNQEQLTAGT